MNRASCILGFAIAAALSACAPRVTRPVPDTPELGQVADVLTPGGDYDGYSVSRKLQHLVPYQGAYGFVTLTGTGSRPIVVRKRTRRADGMPLSGAPGLRIDPIVMRPSDPRGDDFHAHRIEGLDYKFMQEQGWLFPCEPPGYEWLCRPANSQIVTPSFKFVDPLIEYLGRWLKERGHEGSVTISVWRPRGHAGEIRTPFGKHEGFTLEWARGPDVPEGSAVALVGHGSRLFPPLDDAQPEAYEKRGNTAVLIGGPGDQGTGHLSRSRSYPPSVVYIHVVSYADVDAAIAEWGRRLREGNHQGVIFILASGPWFSQSG